MTDTEHRFGDAMFAIYQEAVKLGYKPTLFIQMLLDKGSFETARQLINSSISSYGYTRLWELGRLDLSVEAVIHDIEEWHDLLTQDEQQR